MTQASPLGFEKRQGLGVGWSIGLCYEGGARNRLRGLKTPTGLITQVLFVPFDPFVLLVTHSVLHIWSYFRFLGCLMMVINVATLSFLYVSDCTYFVQNSSP